MKRKHILLLSLLTLSVSLNAQDLVVHFNYSSFATNENDTYIETYLSVPQATLKNVKKDNGMYNAEMSVTMIFKQGDSIAQYSKYSIVGQENADTATIDDNLIDLQRLFLDNGEYMMELTVRDKNDTANVLKGNTKIVVNIPKDQPSASTVCFIDSYTKTVERNMLTRGSYDMIPYFSTFFPDNKNMLTFYCELYNLTSLLPEDSRIAVMTHIEYFEINGSYVNGCSSLQRRTTKNVIPVLASVDLTNLPSGNYYAVIQVKDEYGKEIFSTKRFFQRSNPNIVFDEEYLTRLNVPNTFSYQYSGIDTLKYVIKSFTPKATDYEKYFINRVDGENDENVLRNFIYMFWSDRNMIEPQKDFNNYMALVKKVENSYGNAIRRGYDTDRGRVYLQYGPPDHIMENKLASDTSPYEIWQYYQCGSQRNRRFVFASLDAALKDYDLIHSDMIGEVNNPKWQYDLHNNAPITNDNTSYDSSWGNDLDTYFNDPF